LVHIVVMRVKWDATKEEAPAQNELDAAAELNVYVTKGK